MTRPSTAEPTPAPPGRRPARWRSWSTGADQDDDLEVGVAGLELGDHAVQVGDVLVGEGALLEGDVVVAKVVDGASTLWASAGRAARATVVSTATAVAAFRTPSMRCGLLPSKSAASITPPCGEASEAAALARAAAPGSSRSRPLSSGRPLGWCRATRSWRSPGRGRRGAASGCAAGRRRRSTSTQMALVSRTTNPWACQRPTRPGAERGDRRAPGPEVGPLEQRWDDGERQPVHRPARLPGGEGVRWSASGCDDVAEAQPGAGPEASSASRSGRRIASPRVQVPVASGQNASSHTPAVASAWASCPSGDDGLARQISPPRRRSASSQVAAVEGEGRLLDAPHRGVLGDERDGLGTTVREQEPLGRHAHRPSQARPWRRWHPDRCVCIDRGPL